MGDEKRCDFCGGEHGDECPEFAGISSVTGDFVQLLDVVRPWKCRVCGVVEEASASSLIERGWIFVSKFDVTWADCPRCGEADRFKLEADVTRWVARGSPRGEN